MDATVKKIVGMLEDDRVDRRCAAAMVIGELRLKDAEVVDALGRCLGEENRLLQLYALEALAGARAPKIAGLVTPLLDSTDEEIRTQASAILAAQGSRASASLARELQGAPAGRRRAIISILVQNHTLEVLDKVLALLPDPEVGEYTLNALRGELDHLSAEEAEGVRNRVTALLKDKGWLADPSGTSRTLRLLGYLRSPKSVKTILGFATEKSPVPVRLAAIAALRRPLAASSSVQDAVEQLLHFADDADATLARAAIDTLRGLPPPASSSAGLLELAEGRHPEARKYALEMLGRTGSQKVLKTLLGHLASPDPAAREAAAASLAKLEGAAPALVGELEGSLGDAERVRQLGRLIRRQAETLKPAARKSIAELTARALEENLPAAEALLDLLAAIDPEGYSRVLGERAQSHRKARRFDEAFALFGKLDAAGLLDDDGRYAALVCGLCALPSKKELARASRTTDAVLRLLVALLSHGEPVAGKLKREKCLTPDDLFYIGFNFSESKDDEEQAFGAELLSHLFEKAPRSKLGRSAKNKLHLMGLD